MLFTVIIIIIIIIIIFSSFAACTVQGSERQPVPWEEGGGEGSHYLTGTTLFVKSIFLVSGSNFWK